MEHIVVENILLGSSAQFELGWIEFSRYVLGTYSAEGTVLGTRLELKTQMTRAEEAMQWGCVPGISNENLEAAGELWEREHG